jgi:hypothetical protein
MGNIGIGGKRTLTIEPEAVIEMTPGSGIGSIDGGLKIVGTEALPIIIREEYPGAGSWNRIYLNSTHVINEIGFAKISDAGENPTVNTGAVGLWYNA